MRHGDGDSEFLVLTTEIGVGSSSMHKSVAGGVFAKDLCSDLECVGEGGGDGIWDQRCSNMQSLINSLYWTKGVVGDS